MLNLFKFLIRSTWASTVSWVIFLRTEKFTNEKKKNSYPEWAYILVGAQMLELQDLKRKIKWKRKTGLYSMGGNIVAVTV